MGRTIREMGPTNRGPLWGHHKMNAESGLGRISGTACRGTLVALLLSLVAHTALAASLAKAKAYLENGLLDDAKRELIDVRFSEGVTENEIAEALFLLGSIAQQEGNPELAEKHWFELLRDYPASPAAKKARSAPAPLPPTAAPSPSGTSPTNVEGRRASGGATEVKSPLLLTVQVPHNLLGLRRQTVGIRTDVDAVQAGAVWERKREAGFLIDVPDPRIMIARLHTTETRAFVCDKARITDVWLDVYKKEEATKSTPHFYFVAHVRVETGWYRQSINLELTLVTDKGPVRSEGWEDMTIGFGGAASNLTFGAAGVPRVRTASWPVEIAELNEWFAQGAHLVLNVRLEIVD